MLALQNKYKNLSLSSPLTQTALIDSHKNILNNLQIQYNIIELGVDKTNHYYEPMGTKSNFLMHKIGQIRVCISFKYSRKSDNLK